MNADKTIYPDGGLLSPARKTQIGNQHFSDQDLNDWWGAGRTENEVAQRASELGATAEQIATGMSIARNTTHTPNEIKNWVSDPARGYSWSDSGGLLFVGQPERKTAYVPFEQPQTPAQTAKEQITQIPTQSVSDRTATLYAQDSPLNTLARTKSNQYWQSRGLLDSSLAAQSGEAAVLGQAESLATADANLAQASNQFNAGWNNDLLKLDTNFRQDMERLRSQFQHDLSKQDRLNTFTASQSELQRQAQSALQTLQNSGTAERATAQNRYDAMLKANELMSSTARYIADITANANLDDASKSVLINQQIDAATMAARGYSQAYGQDLTAILNFTSLRPNA